MKIERKILVSNVFNLALIVLIGLFAIQNMDLVLTKLRFVEIADDLNASLLEMRLSEKNYFLYNDEAALERIRSRIGETSRSFVAMRSDILPVIGEAELERLERLLANYAGAIEAASRRGRSDGLEAVVRAEGKKLQEFSDTITHLERTRVNALLLSAKNVLLWSFAAILLVAVAVSHFVSKRIVRSVRDIERLAKSISRGDFGAIQGRSTNDEIGAVIEAVNSMSEVLRDREEELVQSRKLASMGILVAGVAHEITNPLNNISMIAQAYTALYDGLSSEKRLSFMTKVESETERIRDIVRNLLDFARTKEPTLRAADANEVARRSVKLVQNMLEVTGIETTLELAEELPPVLVDEHQIQQVLINLLTNAAQAMGPGGRVAISSRPGRQGRIEIAVADTGKGILPEHLPHVFDPFFSTKGEGGTGLGLSVSYGIVKNHGGDIRVESRPGAGTTFTLELPTGERDVASADHGDRR